MGCAFDGTRPPLGLRGSCCTWQVVSIRSRAQSFMFTRPARRAQRLHAAFMLAAVRAPGVVGGPTSSWSLGLPELGWYGPVAQDLSRLLQRSCSVAAEEPAIATHHQEPVVQTGIGANSAVSLPLAHVELRRSTWRACPTAGAPPASTSATRLLRRTEPPQCAPSERTCTSSFPPNTCSPTDARSAAGPDRSELHS